MFKKKTKFCMVEIAFDDYKELEKTINTLLDKKLVGSCQTLESASFWNWKDKRENTKEYILLLKTKKSLLKEIYKIVREIHSYETFEFATFDLTSISKDYLKWIDTQTK